MAVVAEIGEETKKEEEGEGGEEEEEEEEEEERVRWAGHYSSAQQILLVGEGDFSFSLSLATSFGSASNIVATSLDSRADDLVKKYNKAQSNLNSLREMGATVLHGVNAKKMKLHTDLKMRKFDRIVFNFPHAGFKGKEDNPQVINLHRSLVMGFLRNASHMLRPYGQVHISHKTGGPFKRWDLKELASKASLLLVECSDFRIGDYPGYNNKRGDGLFCDEPFPLGECSTFKFRIGETCKKKKAFKKRFSLVPSIEAPSLDLNNLENIRRLNCLPSVAQHGYNMEGRPQSNFLINVDSIRGTITFGPRIRTTSGSLQMTELNLSNAHRGFGISNLHFGRPVQDSLGRTYELQMNEASGRTVSHDVQYQDYVRRTYGLYTNEAPGRAALHDVQYQDSLRMNEAPGRTLPFNVQHQIPEFNLSNAHQGFVDVGRAVQSFPSRGYDLYVNEPPGRTLPYNVQHQIPEFNLSNHHQGFVDVGRAVQSFPSRGYDLYMNEPPERTVLQEKLREQALYRKASL
uniref:25S rRNA (uridine-N(3))-methyltransferase BMT5-like domain-containing protein n=1 Tax=Ananas comosus var. bracteatus TaxID=296719 RepID=A0A6V7QW28_ANACO